MVWISLILLTTSLFAKELPRFLTKHSVESIRFISLDGRYAYVKKRQGVLGMVSSFRSVDFISENSQNDFIVKDSRFKQRLAIEVIPGTHQDLNLLKNHKIMVVDWGKSQTKDIGFGRFSKLHLNDEWITFYNPIEKVITIQNILTEKKFQIRLSQKTSPFFNPEVEMISADTVTYTDVNDKGFSALVQYNLVTLKSNVLYKSSQNATRLELCQGNDYLAIGEFPYDDVSRSSKILHIKVSGSTNLAGYSTIYSSTDSDLGNIICLEKDIYFIKTMGHNKKLNLKQTEAVKLNLKTTKIQVMTDMNAVTQLISMDERILVPYRGDYFVLEGLANLTEDKLKTPEKNNINEELPLEI